MINNTATRGVWPPVNGLMYHEWRWAHYKKSCLVLFLHDTLFHCFSCGELRAAAVRDCPWGIQITVSESILSKIKIYKRSLAVMPGNG